MRKPVKTGYSRKFALTLYFGTACLVLCWYGKLDGAQCVTVITLLAGAYKAANVVDKKLGGSG